MSGYFKAQDPSTFSFLRYLTFRYSKEGTLKANKKEEWADFVIGLKLFLTESNDDSLKIYWEEELRDGNIISKLNILILVGILEDIWKVKVQYGEQCIEVNIVEKIYQNLNREKLDNLAFNNPFLSCIIDLDNIHSILREIFNDRELRAMHKCEKVKKWKYTRPEFEAWVKDLVISNDVNFLQASPPFDLTDIEKKVLWNRRRYEEMSKGGKNILEDTYVHEVVHEIIYETIQGLSDQIQLDWSTKTVEDGNNNVNCDYDS
ncbi:4654_t:CDS:2, partial [Funneliformis caledonium]